MTDRAPIRVTAMIDSLLAGGAERVAVEIACALNREKFTPHVLITRSGGPLVSLLEEADVPYTMLERAGAIEFKAWRRAHQQLKQSSDLIHAHKFGSNAWAALLSRTTKLPLIAHEHNFSAEPSALRSFIERRWIANRAHKIICVSDSVAATEQASGVPKERLEVVANGVRLDAAWPRDEARAALNIPDDDHFALGIIGRLRTEKGHDILLRAHRILIDNGHKVRLCIVGSGPLEAELKELATQLDLDRYIVWAGEHKNAATLAAAFDATVISSHWEGLPLAALESMAAGVPVVASRVGGLPKLLSDGAGLMSTPGDHEELAERITELVTQPDYVSRLGAVSRKRIEENYSFNAMVQRVEELYIDAIAQPADMFARAKQQNKTSGREVA